MSAPRERYGKIIGWLGGRKFVLTIFVQVLNAALVWHDDITSETYGVVTCAVAGAYVAGNVYQSLKGAAQ